ncbi:hypothetical protein Pelo_14296 [Pelomyxa schiedti]|nr:hypothetical protein Pelo_14296 [Pelomyxa schiedti]
MAVAISNAKLCGGPELEKGRKEYGGSDMWWGLPKPPEIHQTKNLEMEGDAFMCILLVVHCSFRLPFPLLSSSSLFGNSQPLAFWEQETRLLVCLLVLMYCCYIAGIFTFPQIYYLFVHIFTASKQIQSIGMPCTSQSAQIPHHISLQQLYITSACCLVDRSIPLANLASSLHSSCCFISDFSVSKTLAFPLLTQYVYIAMSSILVFWKWVLSKDSLPALWGYSDPVLVCESCSSAPTGNTQDWVKPGISKMKCWVDFKKVFLNCFSADTEETL